MTWAFLREQLRSQRTYLAWAIGILALAMAAITFAGLQASTQSELDRVVAARWGTSEPEIAQFDIHLDAITTPTDTAQAVVEGSLDESALTLRLNALDQAGVRYGVVAQGFGHFVGTDNAGVILAVRGAYDWEAAGLNGTAPGADQIALSADTARALGVEIGDSVLVERDATVYRENGFRRIEPSVPAREFEITGLLYPTGSVGGFNVYGPSAIVAWDELAEPDSVLVQEWQTVENPLTSYPLTFVTFGWDDFHPLIGEIIATASSLGERWFFSDRPAGATVALLLTALVSAAATIMAFALGRSQGQRRVQWIATARTLGATQSTLRAAAVVEWLVVGGLAGVVGIGIGYAAHVTSILAIGGRSVGVPLVASVSWVWVGGGALLALGLAAIITAVPVFWAGRVAPAAALKPVNEVTESEVSRRVSVWWLAAPLAAAAATLVWLGGASPIDRDAFQWLAWLVAALAGLPMLLEACRVSAPAIGRRLARSTRPALVVAGEAMQARPRQYAAPMFIVALTAGVVGGVGAVFAWTGGYNASLYPEFNEDVLGALLSGFAIAATLPAFAIVQIVVLAIAINNRFASTADAAVHHALGLTSRARRVADGVAYLVPQAVGTLVGTLVGGVVGSAAFFVNMGVSVHRELGGIAAGDALEVIGVWGTGMVIYVAMAIAFGAVGAAIVASLPSRVSTATAR